MAINRKAVRTAITLYSDRLMISKNRKVAVRPAITLYSDRLMISKNGKYVVRVVQRSIDSDYQVVECIKNDDGRWWPGFFSRKALCAYYRILTPTEKLLYETK